MKKPTLKTWRRVVQYLVAIAFIIVPLLNHYRISYFSGNFLSFNAAGLPLCDPLAVLQITLKNFYLSADLFIGAGIALGLAAILGTVFCSWVCPFGLLSELIQSYSRKVLPKSYKGMAVKGTGFRIKLALSILGLAGFLIFSTTPVLNQLSLPAWYSRIFQVYFEQQHISLAILFLLFILLIESAARKRLWCRYVCPQSFLIIIAKILNRRRLKIEFTLDDCISKGAKQDPCQRACSLSLDPKTLGVSGLEAACSNCGDCVVVCKKLGQALAFQFKRYE